MGIHISLFFCIALINVFIYWCITPILKINRLIVYLNKGNACNSFSKWIPPTEQNKFKLVRIENFDNIYSSIKTKNKFVFEGFQCVTISVKIYVRIYEYTSNQLIEDYSAIRKVKFKFTQFHWKVTSVTT